MDKSLNIKVNCVSLLKFALPIIIANIFMSIYSTIDGVFVSNFIGTDALSAVNIVMPLLMISIAVGTMFGSGGNALISKKLGEGKTQEARKNFTLLILTTIIVSYIISIICFIFRKPILYVLGADATIYNYCEAYAMPVLIILPFALLGILFQMFFISEGKPSISMTSSILGGFINVILDYVLIVKLNLGLQGAAIATGIGYSFPSLVGIIFFALNKKGTLHFTKPNLDFKVIINSCTNGMSEMVSMLSSSIVMVAMNNIMIRLAGTDGVSAITIILYTQSLLSSIYMGYSTGISPLISFNYGKNNTDNLKKIYKISLRAITSISLITFLLSFVLSKPVISIFAKVGTSVFTIAFNGFKIFSISLLFMGINIFSSAMFTALNNGKISAILSFFRTLVFLLVSLLIFPNLFGVTGVWITIPLSEILSIIMSIYCFNKFKNVYKYA